MKTAIVLGAMLMSFTFAQATDGKKDAKCDDKKSCLHDSVSEIMNDLMQYPENRGEELEGSASVMIILDDQGKVHPLMIKTENAELNKYVLEQLDKVQINQSEVIPGETFRFRFDFKYLG